MSLRKASFILVSSQKKKKEKSKPEHLERALRVGLVHLGLLARGGHRGPLAGERALEAVERLGGTERARNIKDMKKNVSTHKT